MTLIEIFDRSPIENLVSTIALEPEQTIYIGTDVKRMQRALPVYREILAGRGIRTDLVFRSAGKNDLEATLQVIGDETRSGRIRRDRSRKGADPSEDYNHWQTMAVESGRYDRTRTGEAEGASPGLSGKAESADPFRSPSVDSEG